MKSRVFKFGDNVDTDQIIPSQYLLLPSIEDMKSHAFEPLMDNFADDVKPGDIVVAGNNFGCGSSREQAPRILKALGVRAIVADSFARIFFRNSINIGLPVIISKDVHKYIKQDDEIELDLEKGLIYADNMELPCTRLPEYMQDILDSGGLLELLKKEVSE